MGDRRTGVEAAALIIKWYREGHNCWYATEIAARLGWSLPGTADLFAELAHVMNVEVQQCLNREGSAIARVFVLSGIPERCNGAPVEQKYRKAAIAAWVLLENDAATGEDVAEALGWYDGDGRPDEGKANKFVSQYLTSVVPVYRAWVKVEA
jgi:hypothetical protein